MIGEIVAVVLLVGFAISCCLMAASARATRLRERREFVSNELRKCLASYEGYGMNARPNVWAVKAALVAYREDLSEQQIKDTELYLAEQYVKENP